MKHVKFALAALLLLGLSRPVMSAEVVINEIHYNPVGGGSSEFLELRNLSADAVSLEGWSFTRGLRTEIGPAVVVPPAGYLVLASDPEVVAQGFGIPVSVIVAWGLSSLSNGGETLTLVDASGVLVDEVTYDDDVPWDITAEGSGLSLQRLCATSESSQPTNWVAGSPTPLAANQVSSCPPPPLPPPAVAINEIHYHPAADRDLDHEFVELTNTTAQSIDLEDYCFTDGIEFCFSGSTLLGPGEFLVVARNSAALSNDFGVSGVVGDFLGQLSNSADRLTLVNAAGELVDSVRYRDSGKWPVAPDGLGFSLEKIVPDAVSDDPASWADSGEFDPLPGEGLWRSVSFSGQATSRRLYIFVEGPGEFLIDDVSLVDVSSPGVNLIPNGEFSLGLSPWEPRGNHSGSGWSQDGDGPFYDDAALHLISDDVGTGSANSVRVEATEELNTSAAVEYQVSFRYLHLSGSDDLVCRLSGSTPSTGLYFSLSGGGSGSISPGNSNVARRPSLPPYVSNVSRSVVEPRSSDPVGISARVRGNPSSVTIQAVLSGGPSTLPMLDNGLSNDGDAGDGLFGVLLPAQPDTTPVTFTIEATSPLGTRLSPPRTDPGRVHGYFVNNNQPEAKVPVYALILPTSNPRNWIDGLDCQTYETCSFAHRGDLYHDIGIRARGQSVCFSFKRFLKLKFHRGHEFDGAFDARRLNLQSLWSDKSLVRERLSWDVFDEMGNPAFFHFFVRVQANGDYFGLYAAYEHPDQRFLDRNRLPNAGNLYKAVDSREQRFGSTGNLTTSYEKKTNENGDFSDLDNFLESIHTVPDNLLSIYFRQNVDEDTMIDYQAAQILTNNSDFVHKNHFLYHDTVKGLWKPVVWDVDLTYGKRWDGNFSGVLNDLMHNPGITPWYSTEVRGPSFVNDLMNIFFRDAGSWYRRAYLVRLWAVLHEKYTPELYDEKIDVLSELIFDEQLLDIAEWGRSPASANDPTAPAEFEPNLDRVRTHIQIRRDYLINYLETTEGFNGNDRLKITELLYNPEGSDDAEFLELWNNSGKSVDISGWTIQGLGVENPDGSRSEFEFPGGSTVAEDEVVVVAKDPAVFAGIYGDVGRVFGPYPGQLDNDGEMLRVKDDGPGYPATVDYLRYETDGDWPRRPDGLGYSLELVGVEADRDNDRGENWRQSILLGGSPGKIQRPGEDGPLFERGNCNGDQSTDVSDVVTILIFVFLGGANPPCVDGCDVNANQRVGIDDAIALLDALFRPGSFSIPDPRPGNCDFSDFGGCLQSNCTASE